MHIRRTALPASFAKFRPMEEPNGGSGNSGERSEYWRSLLSGENKGLAAHNRLFRAIPSAPRCKLCMAPFAGPVAPLFKLLGFRRWALNQQLCGFCIRDLGKHKGGAELPVSLLFADVRGSTTLAETMSPTDYRASLDRFFALVFDAVDSENGVIDHIVGDGVMAMWIPGFVGSDHPQRAVDAGRKLVHDLQIDTGLGASFPVGVGVHTGVAFVGVVGEKGSHDFTVVGDAANTVARLGSAAAGGELIMSESIAQASKVETEELEQRMLELKGKSEPFRGVGRSHVTHVETRSEHAEVGRLDVAHTRRGRVLGRLNHCMPESTLLRLRRPKALLAFVLGVITVAVYLIGMTVQGDNGATETALWAAGMLTPTVLSLAAWLSINDQLSRQLLLWATVFFFVFGALGALTIGSGFILAGAAALYAANEIPRRSAKPALRVDNGKGQLP